MTNSASGRIRGALLTLAILPITLTGCEKKAEESAPSVAKPPTVNIAQAMPRKIVRVVGQPSFIESYERTSIFPKLVGYIEKWNVDIGDKVKKDQTLATLFVPELLEDYQTKKATVQLDQEKIDLANKMVDVASADVKAAQARLAEAKAMLAKYQAEVDRWQTEVARLEKEVTRGVVDPQILLESTNQFKSSSAARDAARSTIEKAQAEVLSREASLAKAKVDVGVAKADLAVAVSDAKRLEAWVGYITLGAPFDGIIVARNANTGDFVQPNSGDPTANARAPYVSPGGTMAPIYVVDRTDIVRIFVDVPEGDANYVKVGSKASVLVRAYRDQPIPGTVTRTAWALNVKSRTLRAEIDLPNPGGQLLPGMYAFARITIDRNDVRALPVGALDHVGENTYCWLNDNGKARRAEVRTGITDGDWIEVTALNRTPGSPDDAAWAPFNGSEQVILGDLSILEDGSPVTVSSGK